MSTGVVSRRVLSLKSHLEGFCTANHRSDFDAEFLRLLGLPLHGGETVVVGGGRTDFCRGRLGLLLAVLEPVRGF